jgi:hypothetical protein
MVRTLRTQVTTAILPSREASRVPLLPPPLLPRRPSPGARCFQRGCLVRVLLPFVPLHRASYVLSAVYHSHTSPSGHHSLTLDLVALPPSSTSPTPTQAPPTAPMLSMAKLIMHRHVRISPCFVSMSRTCQHWLTNYSALLSLRPPLVDASDDALHSLIHHRLHYALPVAVVRCPGYVNLWYLPTITAAFSPHPARCPYYYYYIPRQDQQIAGHVRCAHNASNSQRNSNPSPSHTHPRELHCGNDPISSPSTAHRRVVRAFVIVHPQ